MLLVPLALGWPVPVRCAPPRAAASATQFEIGQVRGEDAALKEAASFFVEGFWQASTTVGENALSDSERVELATLQTDDMIMRYGELVGKRRLESALYLAKDPGRAVVGCVGVEMALIEPLSGKVLSRSQGENLLNSELGRMSARERNVYRKLGAAELTSELFPEYRVCALLANLAVAPSARGQGLASVLCDACDERAIEWDLPAIMLQVEDANVPARKLYESLGYQEIHRDEAAGCLRVQPGQSGSSLLETVDACLLLMGKGLAG